MNKACLVKQRRQCGGGLGLGNRITRRVTGSCGVCLVGVKHADLKRISSG